jgi:aconitase A
MNHDRNRPIDDSIQPYRKERENRLIYLQDYKKNYTLDKLISDLTIYFEGEVDFDLDKIRKDIAKPGRLEKLVEKARKKNTHPVIEFIQELLKDLTAE